MRKKLLLFVSVSMLMVSCSDSAELSEQSNQNVTQEVNNDLASNGFSVLEKNCFSCHSPNAQSNENIASTMKDVKISFLNSFSDEQSFSKAIAEYVNQPSKDKAQVKGAVQKYGTMPSMEFTAEELNAVTYYLFHTEIESNYWYSDLYPKEKELFLLKGESDKSYIERGREYAMATKSVLGKNLMGKIKTVGTLDALTFCNVKAIPLIDSMSNVQNVRIKRVSDKNRNSNNYANEDELAYLQKANKQLTIGDKIKPQMQEIEGRMVGYYPILTNDMCMQCHGTPETQVKPSILEELKNLYPNDKAVGYDVGQLRGIWVIDMEK